MNLFESAQFHTSIAKLEDFKPSILPEIAFVGRSNAGKSTSINVLTRHKRLAFASKMPGRTQLVNFFTLSEKNPDFSLRPVAELVDLPGYGFSQAAPDVRKTWQRLAGGYLATRDNLVGVVMVMDARHPFKDTDLWILETLQTRPVRIHFLLNKADQLKKSEKKPVLDSAKKFAQSIGPFVTAQLFSGLKKEGVSDLEKTLLAWINRQEIS